MKYMNYEMRKEQKISVSPQFVKEITKHTNTSVGLKYNIKSI